jgi:hypothetical protein
LDLPTLEEGKIKMKGTRKTKRGEASAPQTPALSAVKLRAKAITTDVHGFDIDTRHAISLALNNFEFYERGAGGAYTEAELPRERAESERELRAAIAKVEAGRSLRNSGVEPKFDAAAQALLGCLFMPGTPDFVNDTITDLLRLIERKTGVALWVEIDDDTETGDYSAERLARVFAHDSRLALELEEKHDLAAHIAAVLSDKATPVDLHNRLLEAANDLVHDERVTTSAEVLRVALASYTRRAAKHPAEFRI